MVNILKISFLPLLIVLALCACAELNSPYGTGYGYNDPYYPPPPRYDGYYGNRDRDHYKHERRELERERDRLDAERARLEREREQASRPPPPPPRREERCPSGFSPSENKCSREERRRGCQDMRLPGGLGCVKR